MRLFVAAVTVVVTFVVVVLLISRLFPYGAEKAKLVISSLPVGSTKVTVTYYGDSNIAKSSASVTQTVN
jgi:Kef-type K+ transport system membrane component KefB